MWTINRVSCLYLKLLHCFAENVLHNIGLFFLICFEIQNFSAVVFAEINLLFNNP